MADWRGVVGGIVKRERTADGCEGREVEYGCCCEVRCGIVRWVVVLRTRWREVVIECG